MPTSLMKKDPYKHDLEFQNKVKEKVHKAGRERRFRYKETGIIMAADV